MVAEIDPIQVTWLPWLLWTAGAVVHFSSLPRLCPGLPASQQVSISSTFYEQLLRQYSWAENFLCLECGFVIFRRKNIGAKAAHKMLMKLFFAGLLVNNDFLGKANY